jgi:hypothetical protein
MNNTNLKDHRSEVACVNPEALKPEAGVLDEPDSAKPAQRSSYTNPPGYIGWTWFQLPAYVDWRACTGRYCYSADRG